MNRTLLRVTRRGAVALAGTGLLMTLTAGLASAGPDHCVSTGGVVRVQKGTATCSSVAGPGNVATATGAYSEATAGAQSGDQRNRARASGDNSTAFAGVGSGNRATASGDDSGAVAGAGNGNTATASGDRSSATASDGDGNRATSAGDDSDTVARNGDGNTAVATGTASFANANGGDGNVAIARSPGCSALANGGGITARC